MRLCPGRFFAASAVFLRETQNVRSAFCNFCRAALPDRFCGVSRQDFYRKTEPVFPTGAAERTKFAQRVEKWDKKSFLYFRKIE